MFKPKSKLKKEQPDISRSVSEQASISRKSHTNLLPENAFPSESAQSDSGVYTQGLNGLNQSPWNSKVNLLSMMRSRTNSVNIGSQRLNDVKNAQVNDEEMKQIDAFSPDELLNTYGFKGIFKELQNLNRKKFIQMLDSKVDVNAKEQNSGMTLLHLAVELNQPEFVKLLIFGDPATDQDLPQADVNTTNGKGRTPLILVYSTYIGFYV